MATDRSCWCEFSQHKSGAQHDCRRVPEGEALDIYAADWTILGSAVANLAISGSGCFSYPFEWRHEV